MDVNTLTIDEARQLSRMFASNADADPGPWQVGKCYLVRCVTHYAVGRLVAIHPQELVLEDSSWVGDTGRYSEAIKTGQLSEVEVVGTQIIGRFSIVDATEWTHDLPTVTK